MMESAASYETVVVRRKHSARSKIDGARRSKMPEYRIWTSMMARCSNPKVKSYSRYGGRGIKVCIRWREDFENFYRDMGPRPSSKHSIDRIDNDGGYEPDNCRWATPREQTLNRSKGWDAWSEAEIATLTRMYETYHSCEEIAIALDRTVGTIRLRIFNLQLKRNGSITRLVNKNKDLHPVLVANGVDAFVAAASDRTIQRLKHQRERRRVQAEKKAVAISEIMKRDIPRNDKMKALRQSGATLSEIGRLFEITRERVRQIEEVGFAGDDGEIAVGSARKISTTDPAVRRKKIDRLCRAWNSASREARLMFLEAAPHFIFSAISANEVDSDDIFLPRSKQGEKA